MHRRTDLLRERPPGAIRASWMAVGATFRAQFADSLRPTPFVLAALAGLLLAYLGPFESDRATVAQRIVYWPGVVIAGTLLGILVSAAVDALFDREGRRPWLSAALTALVMTPPATIAVLIATRAVFGGEVLPGGFTGMVGPVFLLSLTMAGLNQLAARRGGAEPAERAESGAAPPPVRFLDRLPMRLRGAELYAVESEDHYLRLHTSRGSDLILMRLADAIAELGGLEGTQTHRSWWVARGAVAEVRRGDGRATLVLVSGVQAPVSRRYAPALRAAGWY